MTFPTYPEYKHSGVEWLGAVPANWNKKRLRFIAFLEAGQSPPAAEVNEDVEGLPFLQGNADFGSLNPRPRQSCNTAPKQAKTEDILLSVRAPVGAMNVADQRYGIGRGLCAIRPSNEIDRNYLFYFVWATRQGLHAVATGSTYAAISAAQLGDHVALVPSITEQQLIANFLDHETARIDALIEEQHRLIELLKEKRQAVISHAVTKGLDPDVPMKDSGVEWLGDVPAHWPRKRLKNISPFITVGIVVNPSSYLAEDGLPFIYGGEVKEGYIDTSKARRITVENSKKNRKTMLEPGDLVTMRVGYPGVTAVIPEECEGGNCASVMLIKKGDFSARWLCSVMNSRLIRHQVEMVQYGAAQKQFNISDAVEFWLFSPSTSEQTTIADFIELEAARIENLIAEASSAISLLIERRSALISAAVTGKINVRDWKPPADAVPEPYDMAAESGALYETSRS